MKAIKKHGIIADTEALHVHQTIFKDGDTRYSVFVHRVELIDVDKSEEQDDVWERTITIRFGDGHALTLYLFSKTRSNLSLRDD
jgi:hypothetical protein